MTSAKVIRASFFFFKFPTCLGKYTFFLVCVLFVAILWLSLLCYESVVVQVISLVCFKGAALCGLTNSAGLLISCSYFCLDAAEFVLIHVLFVRWAYKSHPPYISPNGVFFIMLSLLEAKGQLLVWRSTEGPAM